MWEHFRFLCATLVVSSCCSYSEHCWEIPGNTPQLLLPFSFPWSPNEGFIAGVCEKDTAECAWRLPCRAQRAMHRSQSAQLRWSRSCYDANPHICHLIYQHHIYLWEDNLSLCVTLLVFSVCKGVKISHETVFKMKFEKINCNKCTRKPDGLVGVHLLVSSEFSTWMTLNLPPASCGLGRVRFRADQRCVGTLCNVVAVCACMGRLECTLESLAAICTGKACKHWEKLVKGVNSEQVPLVRSSYAFENSQQSLPNFPAEMLWENLPKCLQITLAVSWSEKLICNQGYGRVCMDLPQMNALVTFILPFCTCPSYLLRNKVNCTSVPFFLPRIDECAVAHGGEFNYYLPWGSTPKDNPTLPTYGRNAASQDLARSSFHPEVPEQDGLPTCNDSPTKLSSCQWSVREMANGHKSADK